MKALAQQFFYFKVPKNMILALGLRVGIGPTFREDRDALLPMRERGFTVFLPEMFGKVDKPVSLPYAAFQMARACISREFHVLASGGSSPICDWLRVLCREIHEELGGFGHRRTRNVPDG